MTGNAAKRGMPPWAWGALAVMVALIVFLPAVRFPFLPFWDDDIHVHANPHVAQLSWAGIGALWAGPYQQLYIPLTYSAWAALAALSRWAAGLPVASGPLDPAWFHGANVLVHAASTVFAFLLLRRATAAFFPGTPEGATARAAALGTAFFAMHPLQVEPVAWVSGLRDVLGGCLGLGALAVLFGAGRPGAARWCAATLLFVASLAAKPAGVALPAIAAVLAVLPFRWPWKTIALSLGPWFAAGAAWVFLTSSAQWAAALAQNLVPAWMRPLVATDGLAFYMAKTIWPAGLAADYGRSPDAALAAGWLWWTWTAPAALAVILCAVKPWRIYLVPFAVFAAALLPTLGLVPFNFQVVSTVADRYAYFALVGPALALSMVVAQNRRAWVAALAAAVVAAAAIMTIQRLRLWSEDLRLFAATLETNPRSWKAMHNYASALDDRGRTAEAEPLLREVIARRPDSAEAHNDLAVILWKLERRDEAVIMMRRSVQLRATPGAARNLAQMEAMRGNAAGVAAALEVLVALEPGNAEVRRQLENLRAQTGR